MLDRTDRECNGVLTNESEISLDPRSWMGPAEGRRNVRVRVLLGPRAKFVVYATKSSPVVRL